MRLSEIAKILNSEIRVTDKTIKTFQIDSRKISEGDFFVPLKGKNMMDTTLSQMLSKMELQDFLQKDQQPTKMVSW
ncbi:MAG: hypothetical protein Q9M89_07245 [Persephonella sp.]|nr:hypothetical protein [Persephonella sp.]